MFKLNLANILSAFTKVETQLNEFIEQSKDEQAKLDQKRQELERQRAEVNSESKRVSEQSIKARRVLAKIAALTK